MQTEIDWNKAWTDRIIPQADGGYAIDASMDSLIFRRQLGIPKLCEALELDNWDLCNEERRFRIIDQIDRYLATFHDAQHPHSLVLSGGTGSGKTHLAVGAIKSMCSRRIRPKFVDYRLLLEALRSNFGDDGVEDWIEAEALLIDDFGATEATKIQLSRIATIFSGRIANGRPTILTTNVSFPGGFERLLDDRLVSRMHEGFTFVQFNLPDWRKARAD